MSFNNNTISNSHLDSHADTRAGSAGVVPGAESPYGTSNPTRGPNDIASGHSAENHLSGSHGVQAPHSSHLANKVDPRVPTSSQPQHSTTAPHRTTGIGAGTGLTDAHVGSNHHVGSDVPHNSHGLNQLDPRVTHDMSSSRVGHGVSPAGTEAHNSTTSQFDGRPAGETSHLDQHAHHVPTNSTEGHRGHGAHALNEVDPRHDNDLRRSDDLNNTHIASSGINHPDQHNNTIHQGIPQHGVPQHPHLQATNTSGGAPVHSLTAGAHENPLGPVIPISTRSKPVVHTSETSTGFHHPHGEQHLSGSESVGVPIHERSHQHGTNASTIGGGGGIGAGNTHAGTGRDVNARDKNVSEVAHQHPHGASTGLTGHNNTTTGLTSGKPSLTQQAELKKHEHDLKKDAHHPSSTSTTTPHNSAQSGVGATSHKLTIGEKIKGTVETVVGKTTHNEAKIVEGQALKTGHALPATTHQL